MSCSIPVQVCQLTNTYCIIAYFTTQSIVRTYIRTYTYLLLHNVIVAFSTLHKVSANYIISLLLHMTVL